MRIQKEEKICVITGSRADYGLLKELIRQIRNDDRLQLILLVTGSHLSHQHGLTYHEIKNDGFEIDASIDLELQGDTPIDISRATARAIEGFSVAYLRFQPDLVIMLGDRYELLGASISALFHKIPIAHIHGGEVTAGAIDEAIRHSLTKLSHLHFVATTTYRNRVIQLGEHPDSILVVGGLGVDAIMRLTLLTREELEEELQISFQPRNLLLTFHPVTAGSIDSSVQLKAVLKALFDKQDHLIIITAPNADPDNLTLTKLLEEFESSRDNVAIFKSLGQLKYFSTIAQVDAVIGNSSSGIMEVPSFKKATINIGDRQEGRLRATSVIDCEADVKMIKDAIEKVYTPHFRAMLDNVKNPYGEGGSVEMIMDVLKNTNFERLCKKQFYDLPIQSLPLG